MRLFIAALTLTIAHAASLGSDKCTWGPSYWCSSLQTASTCQAFPHCVDYVWKKQVFHVQPTEVCLSSQKIVETVRRVLSLNNAHAKGDAIHLVASICKFIHDDELRMQCKGLVTDYLPEILKLMESSMEPASVASVLGLCQHQDDKKNETPAAIDGPYYPPTNKTMCTDCLAFVGDLQTLINQPGAEDKFVNVVEDILCSDLGDLTFLCKGLVSEVLPKAFKFLSENDHPETICRLGTFCIDTVSEKPQWNLLLDVIKSTIYDVIGKAEMGAKNEVICHDCEKALTAVVGYDSDSSIRNVVEHAIGFLCSQTDLTEDKCQHLSEGLIPKDLIKALQHGVDIKDVCISKLKCTHPEPEIIPTSHVSAVLTYQSSDCSDCLHFFDDVRAILRDNISAPEAAALAKTIICQQLESFEFECNQLLDTYMPDILNWLADEDVPSTVCARLTLCPTPANPQKFDLVKFVAAAWKDKHIGDFECDECKALVQDARAADRDPDVQRAVVDFLDNICDKLGEEAAQCKALVQQYAPQLFEIIASELEPGVVCEMLLDCTNPEYTQQAEDRATGVRQEPPEAVRIQLTQDNQKKEELSVDSSIQCQVCELVVGTVDNIIGENRTEAAIQSALDDICNHLPEGIKPQCLSFVNEYAATVVQLLIQELDPQQVCIAIGLCQQNETRMHTKSSERAGSVEGPLCSLCELVINQVDIYLGNNRSEAAVKNALDRACSALPSTISAECQSFVNTYTAAIINLLVQEVKPEEVCKTLGLCQTVALEEPKKPEMPTGPLCSLCEIVVEQLDKMIATNKSEMAIEKALDQVCSFFPPIASNCTDFISQYAPALINLLVQELRPQEVCKMLGLCSSAVGEPKKPEMPTGPLCSLCEIVVEQLDKMIATNKSEMAIEKALDQVCTLLPSSIASNCTDFISQYAPALINLLVQELRPQEVCKMLGLCSSAVGVEVPVPQVEEIQDVSADPLECMLCKVIITEINNLIGENKSEEALIHAVETVCDVVQGDLKLQCKSEVENYGPAVLDLLKHMDDPTEVCDYLKVCAAASGSSANASGKEKEVAITDGEVCIICQTLANYAGEALKEQSTVEEVEKLLGDICTILPDNLGSTCNTLVTQFAPAILQYLAEKDDPLEVCQEIGLCSKDHASQQQTMVGVDACTYGPAFWCATMENARKCGVVEDCIQKYGLQP